MNDATALPGHESPFGTRRRLLLANPRGFCAGVERAIGTVERALELYGSPVYVRRAIVHNLAVVERLERLGAVFVQELEEIPSGSIAILSAHGSARSVKSEAEAYSLRFVDAICPLVAKIHAEVEGWYYAGRHVLLIGHQGHPEIVGTLGQLPAGAISVVSRAEDITSLDLAPNTAVAYAVQTTFSVRDAEGMIAEILSRFKDVAGPRTSNICYATTNRQQAAEAIAREADLLLVIGDAMSSNARRYADLFSEYERSQILAAIDSAIVETGRSESRVWGERIEDRGSQITFSGLGQQAPLEAKAAWDPDLVRRRRMQATLSVALPGFSVRIGGSTSIDVTRAGVDKAYGMHKLAHAAKVSFEEMIFIGDAVYPDGNDYPVLEAGIDTIAVRDTDQTKRVIEAIIFCMSGQSTPA